MRIVIASDSFKGSLSSAQVAGIIAEEARGAFPGAQVEALPIADGGEGTVEALLACSGGERVHARVKGPLFEAVDALYGLLPSGEAVIESAEAIGLPMVPPAQRNPLNTTSYGLGELIAHALDRGHRRIWLGLGGSATVDGGLGALSALGVRFLGADGQAVRPVGGSMGAVRSVDARGLHPAVSESEISLLLDVTNPLTGKNGAAHIFGPQKGATPQIVLALEQGMASLGQVALAGGFDMDAHPGSGAAGGLGGAFNAFLGARMRSGIDAILDLMRLDERLMACDLVVTGEGQVDGQSLGGKAVSGVVRRAHALGVPALVFAGGIRPGAEALRRLGACELVPITDAPISLEQAMEEAPRLLRSAAARAFGLLAIGRALRV